MADLSHLSKRALAAVAKTGTAAWGRIGSSAQHARYSEPLPKRRGRRKNCHCGCSQRVTHACMANGVCLGQSCELGAARWVRTGYSKPITRQEGSESNG
jgi:hypothetical protein